ncbi:MAG: DNA cytosine methyltransferase, partial [Bacteroidales bacterium]|nr:DNA cytosine methyltransferase [Bacteroidales bacterium]
MRKLTYIDLFAGAGGLSEGFIQAGFEPIAHVEIEKAACNTLKTRAAYHYLKSNNKYQTYVSYLKGDINRKDLYKHIPSDILDSVINLPIGDEKNEIIQNQIKKAIGNKEVDLIIGGPPCQAYSLVGRARSKNNMEGDPRNYLFVQYAMYLEKYTPKL